MDLDQLIEELKRIREMRGNLDLIVTYREAEAEISHVEVSFCGRKLDVVLASMLLPEDPSERWMEENAEPIQP